MWVGERLGVIERACFRSVLRQGHRLTLYCYKEPAGVPEGVEVVDAGEVVPAETLLVPWCARPDLYSDWFRYELLRQGLGTWIDADVYLVGRIDLERPFLFGEQEPGMLNNAVLRLPADAAVVDELLEPFHRRTTPRWLPPQTYWPLRIREVFSGYADLMRVPWGTTSPHALTALAKKHRLMSQADLADVYYPARWQDAGWIRDPTRRLEDIVTDRTVAVHLWNECIKAYKAQAAPEGSFLQRLQREGA